MTIPATESAPQGIKIALSHEELYLILRLLRAERIPGYDLTWVQTRPDGTIPEESERALEVATAALMARGYLVPGPAPAEGEKIRVDVPSPVLALVGACAFGEYSMLLSLHRAQARSDVYLHELRGLGVAHTFPLPAVHQFESLAGRAGVLALIDRALGLDEQPGVPLDDGRAAAPVVEQARDYALAGECGLAAQILIASGVPSPTARALADAMYGATALGSITIAHQTRYDQHREISLALVVASDVCFTLIPDQGIYQIRAVSAMGIRSWIGAQLTTYPNNLLQKEV